MNSTIVRSILILPVSNRRFVETAFKRGADAIMLDLEDSIPEEEKENARKCVQSAIPTVAKGGGQVQVRVNNKPDRLREDLDASVYPGLDCIVLPKVESAVQIDQLGEEMGALERNRGMEQDRIKILVVIESPKGIIHIQDIAMASHRIDSMSLGLEDYCLELGVEPSSDGFEMLYPFSVMITIAKAFDIRPVGLLGSIAGFRDLEGFTKAAKRACQMGCEGGVCIHPNQVPILNRVFSPDSKRVDHARKIVEAFRSALETGTAAIDVDGEMVDLAVYRRAKKIFDRANAIEELERKKSISIEK